MSPSGASRGIAVSAFGNLIPPLIGLISAPLLAQALGVQGRGEVAAATAPLLLASSLVTLGLPEALTYFTARQLARVKTHVLPAMFGLVFAGLGVTVLILAIAPILAAGSPQVEFLIRIASAAIVPSLLLAGIRGIALGQQRWWLVAGERMTGSISRLIALVILLVASSLSPIAATLVVALTPLLGAAAYIPLLTRQRSPAGASARTSAGRPPTLWRYGMGIWAGSLAGILLSRVDQVLILPLSDATALGLYVVAVTIAELSMVFNSAVRDVMFSIESERSDDDRLQSAGRISTAITLIFGILTTAVSIPLVPFFFGTGFEGAVPMLAILVLGIILGNPGSVAGAGLSSRGRPGLRSWSIVLGLFTNLVLIFALVPTMGGVGAALATCAGNFVAGMLNVWWLKSKFGMPAHAFFGIRRDDMKYVGKIRGLFRRS